MTFYFYDLETTGFNPREGRIMQFAGQRTDTKFKPIGEPDNVLIKITEDIVPDPDAVLVTGITPQKTLTNGITEAEFCRYFDARINQSGTIFVGYNNIRFDDEFMRHLFYRNFYDSYEWHWQDDNSRWDLLDVVRMTRALRPEGIKWPFASDGAPSNQLGLLASVNKLNHSNAHDALSDVQATIDLAKLIQTKQPKLFSWLLKLRKKDEVSALVSKSLPFIYTSGKYPSQFEKTTVVVSLGETARGDGAIVYDLRYDPTDFIDLSVEELARAWRRRDSEEGLILPVKTLKFNRCPAVAPVTTLDEASRMRLQINSSEIENNFKTLKTAKNWPQKLLKAQELLDKQLQDRLLPDEQDVDNQLYSGFFDKADKQAMRLVRDAEPDELSELSDKLKDKRLQALLPLYKARNFKSYLTPDETRQWNDYCHIRLMGKGDESRLAKYFSCIEELKQSTKSKTAQHLLVDLEQYGQSVMPGSGQ